MKMMIQEYAKGYGVNIPIDIRLTAGKFQWHPSLAFTNEGKTYHIYNTWAISATTQESGDQEPQFDLNSIYKILTITTDSDGNPKPTPFPKSAEWVFLKAKSNGIRLEWNQSRSNGINIIGPSWSPIGAVSVFRNDGEWKNQLINLLKRATN